MIPFFAVVADKLNDVGLHNMNPRKVKVIGTALLCFATILWMQASLIQHIYPSSSSTFVEPIVAKLEEISEESTPRDYKYDILTLGGSTSRGLGLDLTEDAYPHIIGRSGHRMTNKAIKATSAFYPSLCIQSMMKNDKTEYDVIIFEFSLSGLQNIDTLVRRLQYRYPNAILIYVHLYDHDSVVGVQDNHLVWKHKKMTQPGPSLVNLFNEVQGYIFSFPTPELPSELGAYK